MPAEGLVKGMPPVWAPPERVRERWVSAFSWEVPKVVAEAATPRPWNMEAMLGLERDTTEDSSTQYSIEGHPGLNTRVYYPIVNRWPL